MSRNKLIIIAAAVLLLGTVIVMVILTNLQNNQPPQKDTKQSDVITPSSGSDSGPSTSPSASPLPPPSTQDFLTATQKSASYLSDTDGQPKFGIIGTKNPLPGWYVVTIRVQGAGEVGKIIFRETNNPDSPLAVVAGPGTSFPKDQVYLPDAVRKALK